MPDTITMTFTVKEWRLMAVAAASINRHCVVDPVTSKPILRAVSLKIAEQTGKFGPTVD